MVIEVRVVEEEDVGVVVVELEVKEVKEVLVINVCWWWWYYNVSNMFGNPSLEK